MKKAPCVYVPLEGRGGIPKRVDAWRFAMALNTITPNESSLGYSINFDVTTGIRFIMDPINLRNASDRAQLVDALTGQDLTGGLLCIDTLAQAGGGGVDENSSEGMGELIRIMQELQNALGGVVLAVHHTGKDPSKGMRGHSSLRGACDFAIECRKPDGDRYAAEMRLDKVKDEEAGAVIPFRMRRVTLGLDEDGDFVTSLVVEHPSSNMPTVMTTPEPTVTAEQMNAVVDEFVWSWIKREVEEGKFPSARSLSSQHNAMKQQCGSIHKRDHIRDAVARLIACLRVKEEKTGAPGGNKWLRAVDGPST